MIISDYGAARHLTARLEIGVDDSVCKQRVGKTVAAVFQSMLPPKNYAPPPPVLSPWSKMGKIFYSSSIDIQRNIMDQARMEGFAMAPWWLEQIHTTQYPLLERMTLFWHSHFTSNIDKVSWPQYMYNQHRLLRHHALGNFADMLHDIAKDPAMLVYLDGVRNVAKSPNENFARELLELFTLGTGHYSESDIVNVARAFSGWSVDLPANQFVFQPTQHDESKKTVLGRTANLDGDDVLNILLQAPRTAEHIAEKFWAEFINHDTPDPVVIKAWGKAFRDSGYEILALLKAVINSRVFWDVNQRGRLIKTPVEFTGGLLRELKLSLSDYTTLSNINRELGQDLFRPPDVKGWRKGYSWITNSRLVRRYDLIPKLLSEHAGEVQSLLLNNVVLPKLPVQSKGYFSKGYFSDLIKAMGQEADCRANSTVLSDWLLPIAPVSEPDCNQSTDQMLRTVLLDPVYQLR